MKNLTIKQLLTIIFFLIISALIMSIGYTSLSGIIDPIAHNSSIQLFNINSNSDDNVSINPINNSINKHINNHYSYIEPNWNISISGINEISKTEGTTIIDPASHTNMTATFNVGFKTMGDYIVYEVTIRNKGNLDAILDNITFIPELNNDDSIVYELFNIYTGEVLKAGETKKAYLTISYNDKFKNKINKKDILILFDYKQK